MNIKSYPMPCSLTLPEHYYSGTIFSLLINHNIKLMLNFTFSYFTCYVVWFALNDNTLFKSTYSFTLKTGQINSYVLKINIMIQNWKNKCLIDKKLEKIVKKCKIKVFL